MAAAQAEDSRLPDAATARALDVPVYTQDADFDEVPGVQVVRV